MRKRIFCILLLVILIKLGEVKIPTSVTQARASISGLQGYNMNSAAWLSAVVIAKIGNIN